MELNCDKDNYYSLFQKLNEMKAVFSTRKCSCKTCVCDCSGLLTLGELEEAFGKQVIGYVRSYGLVYLEKISDECIRRDRIVMQQEGADTDYIYINVPCGNEEFDKMIQMLKRQKKNLEETINLFYGKVLTFAV